MARRRWLSYAAVAFLAGAIFAETPRFGFVFDDEHLIVNNRFLREPCSPVLAFGHHFWHGTPSGTGYYRPIVIASLALNGRLLGWGPAGFHLVNLLLHALNACLVLALGRRLRLAGWGPELAAALFAVHPAAAWPVASIVARVDLLPALFILLAWIAHASADYCGSPVRALASVILAGLCFFAALLCKESAVAFLAVPLLDLRLGRRFDGRSDDGQPIPRSASTWDRWGTVVSTWAAAVAYVAIRSRLGIGLFLGPEQIDPLMNPLSRLPLPERLWGALALAGRYLLYLLLPARFGDPRGYSPGSALPSLVDPWTILGALLLCGWAWLLGMLWRRKDQALVLLAFTLASFLPASNLLVPIAALYAQNFLYLPLLGLALAAGDLCGRLRPE